MNTAYKIFGFTVLLLITFSLIPTSLASETKTENNDAEEKTLSFLTDVLRINLSSYILSQKGTGVNYPSEYGGAVKQTSVAFIYNSTENRTALSVSAIYYNSNIWWFHVSTFGHPLNFLEQPSTSALNTTRAILERYQTFATKYNINTPLDTILTLLSQSADWPHPSDQSANFANVSDFAYVNETLGDVQMVTSDSGAGWVYVAGGIAVINRYFSVTYNTGTFVLTDLWGLYHVASFGSLTQDQASAIALEAAKKAAPSLVGQTPDWSHPEVEIGMVMIPGQQFNNELSLQLRPSPSATINRNGVVFPTPVRDPLGLYPYWAAKVYFTYSIGNYVGIQVGIWGDTREVDSVTTYITHGGGREYVPTPTLGPSPIRTATPAESPPTPNVSSLLATSESADPLPSNTATFNAESSLFTFDLTLVLVAAAFLCALLVACLAVRRNH